MLPISILYTNVQLFFHPYLLLCKSISSFKVDMSVHFGRWCFSHTFNFQLDFIQRNISNNFILMINHINV